LHATLTPGKRWEGAHRQIAGTDGLGERKGPGLLNVVFPGTGKHVEDSKSRHGTEVFPLWKGSHENTDPRLDILQRRVSPIEARTAVGRPPKILVKTVNRFCASRGRVAGFISEAQVECQV